MVDRTRLRELLDAFRFDEAFDMLDGDADPDLIDEVAGRRDDAAKQAEVVVQQLIDLGTKGDLDEFLAVVDDPVNQRMIPLASPSARERLSVYSEEADRWRIHQFAVNERRLTEAQRALDGLDFGLAQGLISKLDEAYLTEEGHEMRDRILLEISARSMEVEPLAQIAAAQKQTRRKGRRNKKRGRRRS